ncbi:hypothetical protein HMPREF1989_00577 [Porphyromonas gingivalis F0566]|nr:hypothetical protein HMPREF1989_00577 [Porphyromonas gingivalis F0566]
MAESESYQKLLNPNSGVVVSESNHLLAVNKSRRKRRMFYRILRVVRSRDVTERTVRSKASVSD